MLSLVNLPTVPVDEGARRLALAQLDKAGVARARLRHGADPEALHDYRVALRRLRSVIQAYRKPLRSSVTRKTEQRLRRLAHGTNRLRDLEVHLGWLNQQRDRASVTERPGVVWMIARLARGRDEAGEDMLELDGRLFPKLHARLSDQLSRFRASIDLTDGSRRRSTAAVTARRGRRDAARLRNRLQRIQGYSSVEAIHRARIAAKHLRYLLEPFLELVPETASAVERLKALQDGFGDARDSQVFASELTAALPKAERAAAAARPLVPGVEALRAALQARGQHAYDQVAGEWLGDAADEFFASMDVVADAIAALADRDQEIERKFLLTGLPLLDRAEAPVEIEQGYLPGERLVERVRRIASQQGVELARTVKEGSGLTRLEVEEPITTEVFDGLWPLTEGRRLRKRRYRVPEGNLVWEIDQFLDRDLVLAEVELAPGAPTEVEIPAWLQPHVEREVTGDEAYSNFKLASNG